MYKEEILLQAAIELNPDYFYEFKRGTLGLTLYVRAPRKKEARKIRKEMPGNFKGHYVVVTYHNHPEEELSLQ